MKLEVKDNQSILTMPVLALTHEGEELIWEVTSTDKSYVSKEFDLFEQINAFWSHLSQPKLNEIFQTYKEIHTLFHTVHDREPLTKGLYGVVAKLLDLHVFDDVKFWVNFKSGGKVNIPDEAVLKTDYVVSADKPSTREQTYIRDDYVNLVTMTIILRCMIPVWGQFIKKTKPEVKNTYKEYYAFKLIYKSKLMASDTMLKLKTYVEYSAQIGKNKAASILDGMSSEDFPGWILGLVVTKKLCVGDIRGLDSEAVLIIHIYNFVNTKVKGTDSSFNGTGGMIKDKTFDQSSADGEQSFSRLEGYKERQELAPGDTVAIEDSVSDPYVIAAKLLPDYDKNLVKRALKTSSVLSNIRVKDVQIDLLKWCAKKVITTRAVDYLSKASLIRLMGVTQAVLWQRGHREIAALLTAKQGETTQELITTSSDSKSRLPKEIIEELNILFPNTRKPNSKSKTVKTVNLGLDSIESVTETLKETNWVLTMEDDCVKELTGSTNQRRYIIPSNIRTLLALLVIDNNKNR